MDHHPEHQHVDRARAATRPTEDEQRRQRRRQEGSEERNHRHKTSEYSERQPIWNIEYVESRRGERAEERHRQKLADDVGAKGVGKIAQHIAQSFSAIDPANAAAYDANYKKFEAAINARLQQWGAALLPFKGQHIVAYHDSWPYFGHRFGLEIDIFLEPKPGIPPSPSHLAEVIAQMKAQKIKAIIVEPYHDRKIAERVASATGAKVVDFAQYPGALPGTDNYIELIDALVSRLAAALK